MSSSPESQTKQPETKEDAESLIPQFRLTRILNQDQNGRRITLLGTINSQQGLLILERAAFPTDATIITNLISTLTNTTNLGANDIYRWYMSNINTNTYTPTPTPDDSNDTTTTSNTTPPPPDLKINLIYPCTPKHITKYTPQRLHHITETPTLYTTHIKPWISHTQRSPARLDWIHNILDGITEQDDIVYRSPTFGTWTRPDRSDSTGFLLLPDLNWDRRGVEGMHLLALVERRDLWSLRGLKRRDVPWLKVLRGEIVSAAAGVARGLLGADAGADGADDSDEYERGPETDEDQFKCYVHYQPTYYHFHVHVVHVMLEAGGTQAVGKAFSLEAVIAQLETMGGGEEAGMEGVDVSFTVGEESELWKGCFGRLKKGESVVLND